MQTRVFVYDDNDSRRDSLKALIELTQDLEFAGSAPNCSQVVEDMKTANPHVVLMDINMPEVDGMEGLQQIRRNFPLIKVLMQTVFDDTEKVFESIRNGASGYILKKDPPQRILDAIQEVQTGGAVMNPSIARKVLDYFQPKNKEIPLTQREAEVLRMLADGLSYKMVAHELNLSIHTVNTHIRNIYDKLHVASLGEAIAYFYRNLR